MVHANPGLRPGLLSDVPTGLYVIARVGRSGPTDMNLPVVQGKRSMGCAHHFRPTYALANVGHPSIPSDGDPAEKVVDCHLRFWLAGTGAQQLRYGEFQAHFSV
jgi:hypothetical protein